MKDGDIRIRPNKELYQETEGFVKLTKNGRMRHERTKTNGQIE